MDQKYVKYHEIAPCLYLQSGRCKRLLLIVSILVIIFASILSCSNNSADKTQPVPYFPVQKNVPQIMYLMLLHGTLVMDKDGYLRVNVTKDLPALVIWPYGYSLKIEGKEIQVINDKGQIVAKVGDTVTLGGGFVPLVSDVEERIGHALPKNATGPYFISNPQ
jgi:hypothetical protein